MEYSLHYNLLAAHTLFQKQFLSRLYREYPGLLPGQPKVIDYLMSHPGSYQREIADGCLVDPATLSPILGKMERQGLILRTRTEGNRKNSIVALSPEGEKTGRRIRELFRETEQYAAGEIPEEERRILLQSLRRIRKNCRRKSA